MSYIRKRQGINKAQKDALMKRSPDRLLFINTRDGLKRKYHCSVEECYRGAEVLVNQFIELGRQGEILLRHVRRDEYLPLPFYTDGTDGEDEDGAYRLMVEAAVDRKANDHVIRNWVAAHILIDAANIKLDTVPSPAAPGLLKWAKDNQDKFYEKFASGAAKASSGGSSGNTGTGTSDDNSELVDAEQRIRDLCDEDGFELDTEEDPVEPALSPQGAVSSSE